MYLICQNQKRMEPTKNLMVIVSAYLVGLYLLLLLLEEWGVIIAAVLSVSGLFAEGLAIIDRLDRVEKKLDALTSSPSELPVSPQEKQKSE